MICAWIGEDEIIPFDSIEYVERQNMDVIEVTMHSKEKCNVNGAENVNAFRHEYIEYIKLMSKATGLLEELEQ